MTISLEFWHEGWVNTDPTFFAFAMIYSDGFCCCSTSCVWIGFMDLDYFCHLFRAHFQLILEIVDTIYTSSRSPPSLESVSDSIRATVFFLFDILGINSTNSTPSPCLYVLCLSVRLRRQLFCTEVGGVMRLDYIQ